MDDTDPEVKTINNKWQQSLLPFMTRTIILLAVFFFVASLFQVIYLNYVISQAPHFDAKESLSLLKNDPSIKYDQLLAATRLKSLVLLENTAMENQYHQANVLLMARLWTSYIGFVTGMILAITGAAFILGKLIGPESQLDSDVAGNKLSFKSASPGLSLCVLGTILMVTTIIVHHEIDVNHNSIYIGDKQMNSAAPLDVPLLTKPPKPDSSSKAKNNPHLQKSTKETASKKDPTDMPPLLKPPKKEQ